MSSSGGYFWQPCARNVTRARGPHAVTTFSGNKTTADGSTSVQEPSQNGSPSGSESRPASHRFSHRLVVVKILPAEEVTNASDCQNGGEADANNNNGIKSEKYSLRPRSLRQKTEKGLELKRDILTQRNKKCGDKNKPKQKPPPLSKYRRKTANARERNRMREINIAFETLRRAVPHISGNINSGNEKLTKITTLRLAMKYIQALRQVLDNGHPTDTSHGNGLVCDDTDLDILLSDGESLHFNSDISESFASPDHPLTSPVSEPSENSPLFVDSSHFPENNFPFHDSLMVSDFPFDDSLPTSDFTHDFFNSQTVRLI